MNTLYVTAWTTFYKVLSGPSGAVNQWVPFDPAIVNFKPATPYSVLLRDVDAVAVYEEIGQNQVRVFPNPSSDIVSIEWTSDVTELQVIDALGRTVHEKRNLVGQQQYQMDITEWARGAYTIRILGTTAQSVHIFLKH